MKRILALLSFGLLSLVLVNSVLAQSLGNAGTLDGTVTDPSGSAVPKAIVTIVNRVTDYKQSVTTDSHGAFRLTNIPPNPYHMEVSAPSFSPYDQDVTIRGAVPVSLKVQLAVAGTKTA